MQNCLHAAAAAVAINTPYSRAYLDYIGILISVYFLWIFKYHHLLLLLLLCERVSEIGVHTMLFLVSEKEASKRARFMYF